MLQSQSIHSKAQQIPVTFQNLSKREFILNVQTTLKLANTKLAWWYRGIFYLFQFYSN